MAVALRQRAGQAPFTARCESRFALALQHTARAADRACRYAAARQMAQVFAAALDMVPTPMVVVGDQGAVLFRNQAALPALTRGELTEGLDQARAALDRVRASGDKRPISVPADIGEGWRLASVQLPDGWVAAVLTRPESATALPGPTPGLTEREGEVATLVARGLTNLQIAAAMSITVNTVKRHLKSAFRKLDVASRAQLVAHLYDG